MTFLRPAERCLVLARCRLAEFERLSVVQLAVLLQRRVGIRQRLPPPAAWLERGAVDRDHLTIGSLRCTFLWEPGYSQILREIHDPPVVLFHRGAQPLPPAAPMVAVVGTRRPTGQGRGTAFEFGFDLARRGMVTVSGLARGIDLEAHRGSLAGWQGDGCSTVAVLGCGIDQVYPSSSRGVAHEVLRRGCVVSEFAPGTAPFPHHFPLRNRIIAGLSRAVLVVEAPTKSGALITARCAADEGREVLVAAGTLGGSRATGSEALAASGAALAGNAAELLREAGLWHHTQATRPAAGSLGSTTPPQDHRATGAWLARMFALERERRVVVNHGFISVAEGSEYADERR